MNKYRIKEIVYQNGSKSYVIQKKFLFWYRDIKFLASYGGYNIYDMTFVHNGYEKISNKFSSVEKCKQILEWLALGPDCNMAFDTKLNQYVYIYSFKIYTYHAAPTKELILDVIQKYEDVHNIKEINNINVSISYE